MGGRRNRNRSRRLQAELTGMDLYDRCITGLRLTPVSTKAVDAAAVLFESISQVRQLKVIVGTALLRTGPDGRLTLTAYGERFARDVLPALESLAQSRNQSASHAP